MTGSSTIREAGSLRLVSHETRSFLMESASHVVQVDQVRDTNLARNWRETTWTIAWSGAVNNNMGVESIRLARSSRGLNDEFNTGTGTAIKESQVFYSIRESILNWISNGNPNLKDLYFVTCQLIFNMSRRIVILAILPKQYWLSFCPSSLLESRRCCTVG